jgi:hypothetical protein
VAQESFITFIVNLPLLAFDIYAKNEKDDLTPSEKKQLRKIVERFVKANTGGE